MLDLLPILEPAGAGPAYEQIASALRGAIESGELSPGDRLPTVRLAAGALGVNFNTVARAYRLLESEGLLDTQRGRGTFVRIGSESRGLRPLVHGFLQRAYRQGYEPIDVRWETSSAIRSWMQAGAPPGAET
jgi:DNA-binding transcriptional regulator YhcF (GntR family)